MVSIEKPLKIVSGGQTGVDRAALDVALERGYACGGWCPEGRRALDGVIPLKYPLKETNSTQYEQRTRLNVQDSDATLILNFGKLGGGTLYTAEMAKQHHKPLLIVALDESTDPRQVADWIREHHIQVLNVAGPREDGQGRIYSMATAFLRQVL